MPQPPTNSNLKLFGLIGYPLSHSFSMSFFSEKFRAEKNKNCQYVNFELPKLHAFKNLIESNKNLCGLNVTIPHKQTIIPFLDLVDNVASEIGAVNTIQFTNNKLIGYNTDVIGFENTFSKLVKPHHTHALILGTGGSSKAVAYVLGKIGIKYLHVSRTPTISQLNYEDVSGFILQQYKIIINCTPIGMFPDINTYPKIDYASITPQHICYDLIYNPSETEFLKKSKVKGALTINGLQMLIEQANAAWKIWNC